MSTQEDSSSTGTISETSQPENPSKVQWNINKLSETTSTHSPTKDEVPVWLVEEREKEKRKFEEMKEWFGKDWPPLWFNIRNTRYYMNRDGTIEKTETKLDSEWIREYNEQLAKQ